MLIKKIIHSTAVRWVIHYPAAYLGLIYFALTKKTPWVSYWSMRKIYAGKGREFLIRFSKRLAAVEKRQKNTFAISDSLFKYTNADINKIASTLQQDGYCVMPFTLPDAIIENLTEIARKYPCIVRDSSTPDIKEFFDTSSSKGSRFDLLEKDLLAEATVLSLATDSLFLKIAEDYLNAVPINDLIAMWWNLPCKNPDKSLLAQMYHFDLDRPRFLKFFFYLTDVDNNNGPHCYMKGSHRDKPSKLNQDRRYTDEEISNAFSPDREIVFTGKRGLILAEDTLGFHKGQELVSGHRLLFQLEYTSSLFGQVYQSAKAADLNKETKDTMKKYPITWQRFLK